MSAQVKSERSVLITNLHFVRDITDTPFYLN